MPSDGPLGHSSQFFPDDAFDGEARTPPCIIPTFVPPTNARGGDWDWESSCLRS